jgi:site-specific DNA recombinase
MGKTHRTDPKKAIGYVRVSTDRQDLGPDAQRDALQRWALTSGVELVSVHEDTCCGATPLDGRPGLLLAIGDLREHQAGVLVVAKRDRLARDVIIAAMVESLVAREGARVISAAGEGTDADDPAGLLLRRMVDCFSEYERALIRARTKAALGVKKARGERVGSVPYGHRLAPCGHRLEAEPYEQAAKALARALKAEGRTLKAIGTALVAAGQHPRKGGAWHPETIRSLLR